MQRGEARLEFSSLSKASRSRVAMVRQHKAQRPHAQTNRSGVYREASEELALLPEHELRTSNSHS